MTLPTCPLFSRGAHRQTGCVPTFARTRAYTFITRFTETKSMLCVKHYGWHQKYPLTHNGHTGKHRLCHTHVPTHTFMQRSKHGPSTHFHRHTNMFSGKTDTLLHRFTRDTYTNKCLPNMCAHAHKHKYTSCFSPEARKSTFTLVSLPAASPDQPSASARARPCRTACGQVSAPGNESQRKK